MIERMVDGDALIQPQSDTDSASHTKRKRHGDAFSVGCFLVFVVGLSIVFKTGQNGVDSKELLRKSSGYVSEGPFKIFQPWNERYPFPCYPFTKGKNKDTKRGLFYVKIPKTASSTLSGIALRIAHHKSYLLGRDMEKGCNVEEAHGEARAGFHYERRAKEKSFLYSFIRDPTSRSLSYYFYNHVSRKGEDPTDANFISWASNRSVQDYQLKYLQLRDNATAEETVQDVLNEYNFVGLTERLDESLVVLQMLLGLDTGDLLYLSSKRSKGYAFAHNGKRRQCLYVQPKVVSPGMKEYFQSEEWQSRIQGDVMLYRAVNRSLDATIEWLGRNEFNANLQKLQNATASAQKICEPKVTFPCSPEGELVEETDCYQEDKGCGYQCLDEIASEIDVQSYV